MCGIHPDVEWIAKKISKKVMDNEDWKIFINSIKDYNFEIITYQFNPENNLKHTTEELRILINNFSKDIIDSHKEDKFKGVFIFPDNNKLYLSELSLIIMLGRTIGDLITEKTNLCVTSWWNANICEHTDRQLNFVIPKLNIMKIYKK